MKTILVAENREVSRELARVLLEHSGYAVLEATMELKPLNQHRRSFRI